MAGAAAGGLISVCAIPDALPVPAPGTPRNRRLIDRGGAKLVRDRDMLAGAVNFLLNNDRARHNMMAAGLAAVDEMKGALERTMRALDPYIQPLVVKARLEDGNGRRR